MTAEWAGRAAEKKYSNSRGSHASWKVLDFFLENSRMLESPGKSLWSWKVLEIKA